MSVAPKVKSTARRAARTAKGAIAKVPGPSNNPATNLLIMDIAMRGASMIAGRAVEKVILSARYSGRKAGDIVQGRSFVQSMAATSAARVATKSIPGFLLVAGGLVAKTIFDRSFSKRESVNRGEKQLTEQAAQAPEE
jgi:hypothetical protein